MKQNRLPIFRTRLFALMTERGKTVTEFAAELDISRQTAGFYLNGDRIPDAATLAKICEACNVSSDYLLGLSNDPKREPSAIDKLGLSQDLITALEEHKATGELVGLNDIINGIWRSLDRARFDVSLAIKAAAKDAATISSGGYDESPVRDALDHCLSFFGHKAYTDAVFCAANKQEAIRTVNNGFEKWLDEVVNKGAARGASSPDVYAASGLTFDECIMMLQTAKEDAEGVEDLDDGEY